MIPPFKMELEYIDGKNELLQTELVTSPDGVRNIVASACVGGVIQQCVIIDSEGYREVVVITPPKVGPGYEVTITVRK